MLTYILLFYQDLAKKKPTLKKLPSVFPIMLYNGYIPEFRYYQIIENEFSRVSLKKLKSISAALFLIENSERQTVTKYVENLISILESETRMKRAFQKVKTEGKIEGMISGKREGEREKTTEIARNLLKKNYALSDIAEVTGLAVAEIKKIRK